MQLQIKRKDIIEMIELCFMNVTQFLSDAELIHSQKPRFDHSVALIQFAIEELGKASILRKKLQETRDDVIEVPDKLFGGRGSHEFKEKEAWTVLSPQLRILAEGSFGSGFGSGFETEDVELSHEERLRCLFVDFKDGVIRLGVAVDSQKLEKIIESTKKEVERLKASWIP